LKKIILNIVIAVAFLALTASVNAGEVNKAFLALEPSIKVGMDMSKLTVNAAYIQSETKSTEAQMMVAYGTMVVAINTSEDRVVPCLYEMTEMNPYAVSLEVSDSSVNVTHSAAILSAMTYAANHSGFLAQAKMIGDTSGTVMPLVPVNSIYGFVGVGMVS
jgi:hypothetical protein